VIGAAVGRDGRIAVDAGEAYAAALLLVGATLVVLTRRRGAARS
jgi:hypothetical protein